MKTSNNLQSAHLKIPGGERSGKETAAADGKKAGPPVRGRRSSPRRGHESHRPATVSKPSGCPVPPAWHSQGRRGEGGGCAPDSALGASPRGVPAGLRRERPRGNAPSPRFSVSPHQAFSKLGLSAAYATPGHLPPGEDTHRRPPPRQGKRQLLPPTPSPAGRCRPLGQGATPGAG